MSKPRRAPRPPETVPAPDPAFRRVLEAEKQASTLQLLFKAARLADEEAVRRVAAVEGAPKLRRSHTALLPYLDLEGTRISDLAERLGVSKQAVSELVDDLERFGVVKRMADPSDARARRVVFTPRGLAGLRDGLAVLRDFERELGRAVGERTLRDLHAALLRVLGHLAHLEKSRP